MTVRALLFAFTSAAFSVEPGMVFIPGGAFERGRTFEWSDADVKWYPASHQDDLPVKTITVDPFYVDETEVTNERYAAFAKATRHRTPYQWRRGQFGEGKAKHPVVNVSWDDAAAFCAWDRKRLPTEAEWERAARGEAARRMFPWAGDKITAKQAVYGQSDGPKAVCSVEKSGFGTCDMIGNVWEWCSDWYQRSYYAESPERNPAGPSSGMYRVLRGGSWFDDPPLFLTNSYRSWARQQERSPTIGFRCARSFPHR
ncbi:MAG: SUMF1/EgtB/PvdO family nonheme iron enzyme [Bryobacteraceae bacterium]